ncbi:hypothetical protein SLEP1_g8782 [Rubroshorea leprosula]|uniref:TPX2 central domain-containing protein n=1 Tax=Rubroshorea leprosula TaxID=152421 RepID=A0AAV5I2U8_9ROSI|nr:hypothetical protein SLEP1_g8782 [Rubroshorea leprosula]
MEEEMEIEPVFEVREIDLDYEFDAARFFDFTREESFAEARAAELWFESAPSYPPSPFVKKLVLGEDTLMGNVNVSPKSKEVEDNSTVLNNEPDDALYHEYSVLDVARRDHEGSHGRIFTDIQKVLQKALNKPLQFTAGFAFWDEISKDKLKPKSETGKPFLPRSSTLMKPTASQLAKQNEPHRVAGSRFQKILAQNNKSSLCNSSAVETQAAKRQKLEGGLLRKVGDLNQQSNLVHKAPKKDGAADKNSIHTRLKLTIPREPELETAHRAQRIRPKTGAEQEHPTSTANRFKARPLNRKILEAPSLPLPKKSIPRPPEFQEFHLKTSERAVQHSFAPSSSSLQSNHPVKGPDKPSTSSFADNEARETRRPTTVDTSVQEGSDVKYTFKARPFNKKIFSSKGDIGVFRNSKREITMPMEFNFHTEKRVQQNLPIELFSKLSLTSELQQNNGSQWKMPMPTRTPIKGSKENRLTSFQPVHEIRHLAKEKPPSFGVRQVQCGNDESTEVGNQGSMRSLGIR